MWKLAALAATHVSPGDVLWRPASGQAAVLRRVGDHYQQMMRMQLTWVFDGDGDGDGEVVDCVAVGEDGAPEVAVDGLTDCSAWAEVADWAGSVDRLGDGEAVDGLGDGEVAEAVALELMPVGVGSPGLEIVPGPCGVDVDMVAMAPTGASALPAVGRLPRINRPMMMIPARPPVTVTPNPRPRRFRERRPFGKSAAESPARTSPRSAGLFPPRGAGRGAAWELSSVRALAREPPTDPARPFARAAGRVPVRATSRLARSPASAAAWFSAAGSGSRSGQAASVIQLAERGSCASGAAASTAPQPGQETAPLRCLRHDWQ
jgi:hypothetical protein